MADQAEKRALLHFDDWAGRRAVPVVVVGETPTRYRIRPDGAEPLRLAGRNRWLAPGATALVPRSAVTIPPNGRV